MAILNLFTTSINSVETWLYIPSLIIALIYILLLRSVYKELHADREAGC